MLQMFSSIYLFVLKRGQVCISRQFPPSQNTLNFPAGERSEKCKLIFMLAEAKHN